MVKKGYQKETITLVIYSVAVALVSTAVVYALLSTILKYNELTVIYATNSAGLFSVFIILKQHFPLKLFSRLNVGYILKYLFPAWVLSILLAGFPYAIWRGGNIEGPKQYHVFMSAGIIEKIFFLSSLCLLGPFIEEVIFRGYIYSFLKRNYSGWLSVILTVALFNIFHGGTKMLSFQLAVISLVAIYSYEKSGSIMGSIIYHIFHNTVWFLLVTIGMSYQNK